MLYGFPILLGSLFRFLQSSKIKNCKLWRLPIWLAKQKDQDTSSVSDAPRTRILVKLECPKNNVLKLLRFLKISCGKYLTRDKSRNSKILKDFCSVMIFRIEVSIETATSKPHNFVDEDEVRLADPATSPAKF